MSTTRRFSQLDVFTARPLLGNPLAVVHDASGLDDAQMAAFARWTHLSETTFLLPPTDPAADYRVRIFTPGGELPFAGHPTLGSCHAWLAAGGEPRTPGTVVQQCGVGLVRVRREGARLAFAAPPLRRSGPLDAALVQRIERALSLAPGEVVDHQWVDNGPGWCAVRLASAARVLQLAPDYGAMRELKLGVVGAHTGATVHDAQFEVRAFIGDGYEDPVTGSLNASLAQWLIGSGIAPERYVAAQGAALQRAGRVHVQRIDDDIWIGGDVCALVAGTVQL
ncbi:MAG: PhzF family phenazine biosynthesis protein [Ideonella sp.]|nr:PhzF family phenazine biosynthesis protein [Ideonella sp.]MCC7457352.1 PhzF family phenazine biosynthesis protein [Nitrospira sp.]